MFRSYSYIYIRRWGNVKSFRFTLDKEQNILGITSKGIYIGQRKFFSDLGNGP